MYGGVQFSLLDGRSGDVTTGKRMLSGRFVVADTSGRSETSSDVPDAAALADGAVATLESAEATVTRSVAAA